MYEKEIKKAKVKLPLETRFKNSFDAEHKKRVAAAQVEKYSILSTAQIPSLLKSVSSISEESFILDQSFNSELQITSFKKVSEEFSTTEKRVSEEIVSLSTEAFSLEASLRELQLQQKKNTNKLILNLFYRDIDLQFNASSSFLLKDPVTNIIYNDKYKLHYYPFNGYSLPIFESKKIPIVNIIRDSSESYVGQTIIEENDPEELLNDSFYKILFLDKDRDDDGFVYTSKESYYVGLWFEIGGIQPVNKIVFRTNIDTKISALSYLDQNENEINLSFETFNSQDTVTITFDKITAKSFKIVFAANSPVTTTLYQEQYGRVYCFALNSISFILDTYNNTGYFLSRSTNVSGFSGCIYSDTFLSDSDHIFEAYLKIEAYSSLSNKTKNLTVRLLSSYDTKNTFSLYFLNKEKKYSLYHKNTFSLYFLNKIARLQFSPSSDFSLYKNGTELTLGIDYYFFTSKDSTYSSSIPTIDTNSITEVFVVLKEYDFFSKYSCEYTPLKNAFTPEGLKYSGTSIYGLNKIQNSNIFFYGIIRSLKQGNIKLPILQNYTIELSYEYK